MNLLDGIKINQTITNTKGAQYYGTSYSDNLDVFTMLSRFNSYDSIISMFCRAYDENADLALANLLYILDIRNGKGERRLFQIIYQYLCNYHPEQALRILPFISKLGRFDYILFGLNTPVEKNTIELIQKQLEEDLHSEFPSLLAKWLPSHRTHGKNNLVAKKLISSLGMSEKEYRKVLSELRNKINIVERNLSFKEYDKIDFFKVPAKAMLKYRNVYNKNMKEKFEQYKFLLKQGNSKINTTGLFSYEIIRQVLFGGSDEELYDLMWKNQKNIFLGNQSNLLVVSDTSGSMMSYNAIPYCNSIGLAIYIAERNEGFFKNHFITFSEQPVLQKITGETLFEKVHNMESINALNTDIDKVFDLILKTSIEHQLNQSDLPSHIIVISDMEFDEGVSSKNGTNFNFWKKSFEQEGYQLPIIIFWNVAGSINGIPVTKFDQDVAMISGFSTNVLDHLLSLDKYTPLDIMKEELSVYLEMLDSNI